MNLNFGLIGIFEAHVIEPVQSTLRRFIPEKFLDDKDCLEIMVRHKEMVKEIYHAAGAQQEDFKEYLIKLIGEKQGSDAEKVKDSDEMLNNLMELADVLGIDVSEERDERE